MSEIPRFGVGDNVVIRNRNNDPATKPIPTSPGVVVGYVIAYPDKVSDEPWIADSSELMPVLSVHRVEDVLPKGETVGVWMMKAVTRSK